MNLPRGAAAMLLCVVLSVSPSLSSATGNPPIGILTRAYDATLNSSKSFPGLSVFEGERLSMDANGKLGVRVGSATLAFSRGAVASLQRIEKGAHVDMEGGSTFFAAPENVIIEVHVTDALFRPEPGHATQAEVRQLGPKVVQVLALKGNLEFRYRNEFQLIPEGETYRIYLDAPAEPQKPAGSGSPRGGHSSQSRHLYRGWDSRSSGDGLGVCMI